MTTGEQTAVDQRLDQHSDAMEIILDKIDELTANADILTCQLVSIEARLHELEAIILPAKPDHL